MINSVQLCIMKKIEVKINKRKQNNAIQLHTNGQFYE